MEENTNQKEEKTQPEESLQRLLEQETKMKEEFLNDLKRLQAEFENYRKRIGKERMEFMKYAKEDLLLRLLEILDNFERALKNTKDEGIHLILKQLKSTLEKEGIKEINETHFNPEKHEVISTEEGEENKIIEEFQRGYMLYDKVIRTSKVKVGKGGKNEGKPNSN